MTQVWSIAQEKEGVRVALKHRKTSEWVQNVERTEIANCQKQCPENASSFSPQWATMFKETLFGLRWMCLHFLLEFPQLFFHLFFDRIVTHHLLFVTALVCPLIVLRSSFSFRDLFHSMFPPTEHEVSFEDKHPTWTLQRYPIKTWKHKELKTVVPTAKKWFERRTSWRIKSDKNSTGLS